MAEKFRMLRKKGTGTPFHYSETLKRRGDMMEVQMTHEEILAASEPVAPAPFVLTPTVAVTPALVVPAPAEPVASAIEPIPVVRPKPATNSHKKLQVRKGFQPPKVNAFDTVA